jgi:hypothetical protein
MLAEERYLPGFGIPLLAGRYFDVSLSEESQKLIISETAVKFLGFATAEAAIGQEIKTGPGMQSNPKRSLV